MSVMRGLFPSVHLLWLLWAGHVFCYNDTTQQSVDLLFRLAHDLGAMMADMKTLLMLQNQNYRDIVAKLDIREKTDDLQYRDLLSKVNMISEQLLKPEQGKTGWHGGCEGNVTGLSTIYVKESPITVPCDGRGWLVLMRRVNNDFNFPERDWQDYKAGFGNPTGSFWFGLEQMHRLTSLGQARLRVELQDFEDEERWAEYSFFRIEGEEQGYRLMVSGYNGTAGDSLAWHNGMKFSTQDRDNDYRSDSCAKTYKGAWWYYSCHYSNLNSIYTSDGTVTTAAAGMVWYHWKGYSSSYKENNNGTGTLYLIRDTIDHISINA